MAAHKNLHSMIRVNHAGEYGALRIYAGQLAILKDLPVLSTLQHMYEQEQEHFDAFNKMMITNRVRPTVLSPLWHVGGYALGAITAMMGEKAAMACTVAVEEVIEQHYQDQEEALKDGDLKSLIQKCRAEELEHRDIGLEHQAEEAPFYPLLKAVIKGTVRVAITLSKKI